MGAGYLVILEAIFAGYFRASMRRRTALSLAATLVCGYAICAPAIAILWRLWYSLGMYSGQQVCYSPPLSNSFCTSALSSQFQGLVKVLILPALILIAWMLWLVAGRLLRPLSATAQTVRHLGPQNLGQRLRMTGGPGDPLKELADALDDALDRMAVAYEGQRRFAANASHELRTPLAVQRLLTEVAMDDPASSQDLHRLGAVLLRTNERNERLIEGLLVLAESDRGLTGRVPVRLDELAKSVIDAHQELAGKHGVKLRQTLGERLVPGDPVLLERLISNLVTNAISYNEPGGWVEVEVGGIPALSVRNTGQQVPAEAVSSLFEPFRRLTSERISQGGGAGLGLSIVRSIATAHDGTIHARSRPDGGLIIDIDLPATL